MDLTEKVAAEIKTQYKSMRKFSEAAGIPYSTVASIIKNGIGSTSFDTALRICSVLQINCIIDDIAVFTDKDVMGFLAEYTRLGDKARYLVKTAMDFEYIKQGNVLPLQAVNVASVSDNTKKYLRERLKSST